MTDTRNSNDLDSIFYATGGSLAPTAHHFVGEVRTERTIPIRKGTSRRVENPIRHLATDPVSPDRVTQLIIERNQLHGELAVARWVLDMVVKDHDREVRELNAAIVKRDAEIERLSAIVPAEDPNDTPAWHQPNPLPRGMR